MSLAPRWALALVAVLCLPSATLMAVVGAPTLNNNQPVLNSGSTLTLSWTAPASGTPTSYIVEASSTAGGPPNLAVYDTGNTQTSLVVPGVANGIYYLRVRAVDASGPGPVSNEVQVIVGSAALCPSEPRAFAVSAQSGSTATLTWQTPLTGTVASYVIQAGTAPGAADIGTVDLGTNSLGLTVPGIAPGTYSLRLYARSPTCAAPSFTGPASNEVVLTVGAVSLGAPVLNNNLPVQSSGPNVTLSWTAPTSGVPVGYLVEAAATAGGPVVGTLATGSTQTSLVIPGVPPGTYFIRVRAVGAAGPGPASNEVALTVGATASWSGVIECRAQIAGMGYTHNETQRWVIGLPAQVSSPRTFYTALWSATGSGGNTVKSWTINESRTTDLTATVIASNQLTGFDRTTGGLVITGGIVTSPPPSPALYEMDFPPFTTATPASTVVTGTFSRPTVGGDSPQQPGDASGTLTCTWNLRLQ
ncbi:MAG: fibronectin type III domain-containing protein [Acidobacteria bacterium]|nr:fibronectin type III domain-containing protein [Acidobacteriota bacterium]